MNELNIYLAIASSGPDGFGRCAEVSRMTLNGSRVDSVPTMSPNSQANSFALRQLVEELKAIREAIDDAEVFTTVYTNNEFICNGINKWMKGWIARGWQTKSNTPVKNRELWEQARHLLNACNANLVFMPTGNPPKDAHEQTMQELYDVTRMAVGLPKLSGTTPAAANLDDIMQSAADLLNDEDGVPWHPTSAPEPPPLLPGQGMW